MPLKRQKQRRRLCAHFAHDVTDFAAAQKCGYVAAVFDGMIRFFWASHLEADERGCAATASLPTVFPIADDGSDEPPGPGRSTPLRI